MLFPRRGCGFDISQNMPPSSLREVLSIRHFLSPRPPAYEQSILKGDSNSSDILTLTPFHYI